MNPRVILFTSAALTAATIVGCRSTDANGNSKPFIAFGRSTSTDTTTVTTAPTPTAVVSDDQKPLPGMVKKKPFIAFSHPLHPAGAPTTLLSEHARSDSPVPLSEYPKQMQFALSSFDLQYQTTAAAVERKFGPPAALADYADPWTVYRLTRGRELWLHFSQPDGQSLRSADVIEPTEDGYSRTRVFDSGLDQ